jgi:hypothetical protein
MRWHAGDEMRYIKRSWVRKRGTTEARGPEIFACGADFQHVYNFSVGCLTMVVCVVIALLLWLLLLLL